MQVINVELIKNGEEFYPHQKIKTDYKFKQPQLQWKDLYLSVADLQLP